MLFPNLQPVAAPPGIDLRCCDLFDALADVRGAQLVHADPPWAAWAVEAGKDQRLRIVLCGYEGSAGAPDWRAVPWKAHGGYASQGDGSNTNSRREVLWLSPGCIDGKQPSLFGAR